MLPKKLWLLMSLALAGCQVAVPPVHEKPVAEEAPVAIEAAEKKAVEGVAEGNVGESPVPVIGEVTDGEESAGCVVPQDPETLEDMQLLSDADKLPPDDEGETAIEPAPLYDLPVVKNAKVDYFIDYYARRGHRGFRRWLERSGRYLPMMRDIFAAEGLPQDLAYLAMIESGFNERARSRASAVGPWQFMEGTGRMYGLRNDWWRDERRDPVKATRAAARHLRDLHRMFDGDWPLAIAAYNAGAGKVRQAVRRAGSRDFWEISRHHFLRAETRNYLPKLFAVLHIAKDPAAYGFDDLSYQDPLAYDEVRLPDTTDLDIVARLCGVDYPAILKLNPELKRWCTPPALTDYALRIPAGKQEAFVTAYAQIPAERRANYRHHRVRAGETLGGLAHRYGIRVRDIMLLNRIKDPRKVRIGRNLILPLRPGYSELPVATLADDYVRSGTRSYRVRTGDSLWTIARRFGVTTRKLCAWNGLRADAVLRPGKVLKVAGAAHPSPSLSTYRVQTGDSLWTIAKRFGVTTQKLCAWNGLSADAVLQPGMVLQLKTAGRTVAAQSRRIVYRVRSGDSLWSIGRRFDLAVKEIRSWNNLDENHVLQPGQKLTLLVSGDRRG